MSKARRLKRKAKKRWERWEKFEGPMEIYLDAHKNRMAEQIYQRSPLMDLLFPKESQG